MPDFAWNDWGKRQVERVWDLLDISLLRSAKKGIDPSYKTLVNFLHFSHNLSLITIYTVKFGICRRTSIELSVPIELGYLPA